MPLADIEPGVGDQPEPVIDLTEPEPVVDLTERAPVVDLTEPMPSSTMNPTRSSSST